MLMCKGRKLLQFEHIHIFMTLGFLFQCTVAKPMKGNLEETWSTGDQRLEAAKKVLKNYVEGGDTSSFQSHFGERTFPVESMLHLFRKLRSGHTLHSASGVFSSGKVDTIRSYTTKGAVFNHQYKIHSMPESEALHKAELRFEKEVGKKSLKILLNIEKGQKKIRTSVIRTKPIKRLEHSAVDLTRIVRPWVDGYNGRLTFNMEVSACSNFSCNVVPANSTHLVLFTQDEHFLKELHRNGVMSSNSTTFSLDHVRRRRSTHNRKRNRKQKKSNGRRKRKLCGMRKFTVDFDHIGWGKFIVMPKSYNAKLCSGSCPSPIKYELSPTNHALVQSLMRLGNTKRAPMPCCVPKDLRPLSMLYYEDDDVVIRHHKDMVVESCACR